MATTIVKVHDAFNLLYQKILTKEFSKSLDLKSFEERNLLPLVRTFLLGYFGEVTPEKSVILPTTATGKGKIDFLIDDVAVEFAVTAFLIFNSYFIKVISKQYLYKHTIL
jgi:hypothetical protein